MNTNSIHNIFVTYKSFARMWQKFCQNCQKFCQNYKSFAKSLPELQKFCQKSIDNFKFTDFYIRKNKKGIHGCILKAKGNILKLKSPFFFLHKKTVGSLLVHSLHKP